MAYTKITNFTTKDATNEIIVGAEIDDEFDAISTAIAINDAHIVDATAAHAASAISNTPAGSIAATTVQAAIDELATEKANLSGGTFTGDITMTGASIIEAEGAAVASASSTNIWATDGNTRHITGTTTINDFGTAPQIGARMKLIFDGALILTQSANLNLNGGGSNITTAADDWAEVYADTTTQFDVVVHRKSGLPLATETVTVAKGGTGLTTLTANNVILGNGASNVQFVAPSTSGNVLTSNGTTWESTAPTSGGHTLLGTVTTTSGATQTLGSLTLTDYKFVLCIYNGVSFSASSVNTGISTAEAFTSSGTATDLHYASVLIDLSTGILTCNAGTVLQGGNCGITTASTSIVFDAAIGGAQTFDAGSIKVYGVK